MRLLSNLRFRVLAVSIFLMAGCTTSTISSESTNHQNLLTPTAELKPSTSFTSSLTPSPFAQKTLTATRTPTPTFTPTWTQVPTLPPTQSFNLLLELYADNGGCKLPCWWGIVPGQTSWVVARTKLSAMNSPNGPFGNSAVNRYQFSFPVSKQLDPQLGFFEPTIGVKDGIVTGISLNSRWVSRDFDYSLSDLLEEFGPPDEIWLRVGLDTPYIPQYELNLLYLSKGILVNGTGQVTRKTLSEFVICPKDFKRGSFPPALVLWAPSPIITYQNFNSSIMGRDDSVARDFLPIENWAINFTSHDFYQTYLDPNTEICFEISSTTQSP